MSSLRPYMILVLLLLAGFGLAGLFTYWASNEGMRREIAFPEGTPILIAPRPDALMTPAALTGALDSSLLNQAQSLSAYGISGLEFAEAVSIGMYLPRTGNTVFGFIDPTPIPTPLPYPTSPPLPMPQLAPLPTVIPETGADSGSTQALVYGGEGCAPSDLPVSGILTQRYHYYHSGIDIGIPTGTPVIATHSGIVTYADWSDVGYGYLVILQNGRFITYYAHNTAFNVTAGMTVAKGAILAWSGSTGNSTGPHVHYETRIDDVPVDPLTFELQGFSSC